MNKYYIDIISVKNFGTEQFLIYSYENDKIQDIYRPGLPYMYPKTKLTLDNFWRFSKGLDYIIESFVIKNDY